MDACYHGRGGEHVRLVCIGSVVVVAGCGSYWDLRKGEELPIGCSTLLNYYIDEDGDGWGAPGDSPTPLCVPDEGQKLTATNDLDCDDFDGTITGKVGAVCPQNMDPDGTPDFAGLLRGDSEFVVVYDETLPARFTIAEDHCRSWSGALTGPLASDAHRGLAVLENQAEFNDVVDWLEGIVTAPYAAFVGTLWNGDSSSGDWEWQDGSVDFNFIGFCGGAQPTVTDFYPLLIPSDSAGREALDSHAPEVRLALVYDGVDWCLGLPSDAVLPDAYDEQTGHYLCERPQPDLDTYADRPESGADEGEQGPPGAGQ